jgi:hypothetical protein
MRDIRTSPRECRNRAAACDKLAANGVDQNTREVMLYLAVRWVHLADHDESEVHRVNPSTLNDAEAVAFNQEGQGMVHPEALRAEVRQLLQLATKVGSEAAAKVSELVVELEHRAQLADLAKTNGSKPAGAT